MERGRRIDGVDVRVQLLRARLRQRWLAQVRVASEVLDADEDGERSAGHDAEDRERPEVELGTCVSLSRARGACAFRGALTVKVSEYESTE